MKTPHSKPEENGKAAATTLENLEQPAVELSAEQAAGVHGGGRKGGKGPTEFMTITMEDVLISG